MFLFCVIPVEQKEDKARRLSVNEDLIRRIGENDQNAFYAFYESTKDSIYGYALSFLKNTQDAEDVMQDTYLKIRESASLYKPQGKPMAWVLTVVKNLCLMKFRERAKTTETSEAETLPDFSTVAHTEDKVILESLFRILSDEEREIVLLHAVSGLKHREIAKLLGLQLSTVLSKYSRATKKLKSGLADMEGIL